MNKKIFLILGICCFALLTSCVQDIGPEGVSFDKEAFEENKAKWEKLGIKNYSFDYEFTNPKDYTPSGKIHVTVVDGVGSVNLDDYNFSINLSENKLFYITRIEDFFEHIITIYKMSKQDIENEKYNYIDIQVKYDSAYFFPNYIFLRCETKEYQKHFYYSGEIGLSGPRTSDYNVVISNFKVNEQRD